MSAGVGGTSGASGSRAAAHDGGGGRVVDSRGCGPAGATGGLGGGDRGAGERRGRVEGAGDSDERSPRDEGAARARRGRCASAGTGGRGRGEGARGGGGAGGLIFSLPAANDARPLGRREGGEEGGRASASVDQTHRHPPPPLSISRT